MIIDKKKYLTSLKQNVIFSLFEEVELEMLFPKFIVKSYKLGEVILRQNEPVDGYYLIVNGKARVVNQENTSLTLTSLKAGDGFGERAIISKSNAMATVRSSGKLTILKLPRDEFVLHVLSNPEIKKNLLEYTELVKGFISLKALSIFSKLTTDQIRQLIEAMEYIEIKAGKYIFHEGDYGDAAYVVHKGKIRIIKEEINKTLAICRAGEIIGEISLYKSQPRIASGIIMEDSALYKISKQTFNEILPDIKGTLDDIVAKKLLQHKTFTSDQEDIEGIIYPEFVTVEHKVPKKIGNMKIPCLTINHYSLAGMACIKMILDAKNMVLPAKWQQRAISKIEGNRIDNFSDMSLLLEEVSLFTRKVRLHSKDIKQIVLPSIIVDEENIPMVIFAISNQKLFCCHPIKGLLTITYEKFNSFFNNEILFVSETPEFEQSSINLFSVYFRLIDMVLQYKDLLFWITATSLILMLLGLASPFFTQTIIDKVLVFQDKSLLKIMIFGMICVTIFQLSGHLLRKFLIITIFQRLDAITNTKFINHILQLTPYSFEKYNIGDYTRRFDENRKLIDLFSQTGLALTIDVLVSLFYLGKLFVQNFALTFVGLVFIITQIIIVAISSKKLRQNDQMVFRANTDNTSFIIRMITGIQVVKSLAGEKNFFHEGMNKLSRKLIAEFEGARFANNLDIALELLSNFATISLLLFGTYKVINNEMSIGEFVAFNAVYGLLMDPIGRLTNIWDQLQEIRVSFERIHDIYELPIERRKEHYELTNISGHILIENVCFRYDGMEKDVLSNINLEILPGKKIAIVGRSGCGKSTLISLILGFYSPGTGTIYIDNKNIDNINSSSLLYNIGIVEQNPVLFSGSIKENISKADNDLSYDKIISAASIAGVKDFTDKMPLGLETRVGEGGIGLSGGQVQKIVIARAIVRDPKILILDEGTSSLDTEAESVVMKNLDSLMKGKTTISIAHRLSTVINSDMIVVLDKGSIVETGTHKELIKNNGFYHHLFASGQNSF